MSLPYRARFRRIDLIVRRTSKGKVSCNSASARRVDLRTRRNGENLILSNGLKPALANLGRYGPDQNVMLCDRNRVAVIWLS
jgi:hypothetical protein